MSCNGCSSCGTQSPGVALHIRGRVFVDRAGYDAVIALAGNPNTGKSTVFNALTGLRQHTGNWPGKTVVRAEGAFSRAGKRFKVIDLPGTYSLLSTSVDEQVARDFILFGRPDCTIVVVDSTCLERNLNLALQVMEITPKVVVCVNLLDEARRKRIKVDVAKLSELLGVPAVGTAARRGEGIDELVSTVAGVIEGRIECSPKLAPTPGPLREAVDRVERMVREQLPHTPCARWIAYRLIEGDEQMEKAFVSGELAQLSGESSPQLASSAA